MPRRRVQKTPIIIDVKKVPQKILLREQLVSVNIIHNVIALLLDNNYLCTLTQITVLSCQRPIVELGISYRVVIEGLRSETVI